MNESITKTSDPEMLTGPRVCPWCEEELDTNDDVVHGYHHLEV